MFFKDYETVKQEFRNLICNMGRENYVYEPDRNVDDDVISCFYVHGDQPGCIVGYWLHENGWSLDELCEREGEDAYQLLKVNTRLLIDDETMDAVRELQNYQDSGSTWADAWSTAFEKDYEEEA